MFKNFNNLIATLRIKAVKLLSYIDRISLSKRGFCSKIPEFLLIVT